MPALVCAYPHAPLRLVLVEEGLSASVAKVTANAAVNRSKGGSKRSITVASAGPEIGARTVISYQYALTTGDLLTRDGYETDCNSRSTMGLNTVVYH